MRKVFGNSNSLPISLVLSLSQTIKGLHWDKIDGDNDGEVGARGILYLLIFQQLGQLVRWSWGYNVLLAPPEHIEGTFDNAYSRLESGEVGAEENEPLMGVTTTDSEGDEQNASGSDDTKVDIRRAGTSSGGGCQLGPDTHSGQRTHVTHREDAASFSSRSSDDGLMRSQQHPEFVPTSPFGSIKPSQEVGRITSFPQITPTTIPVDEETLRGLEGVLARGRTAIRRMMRSLSQTTSDGAKGGFNTLPVLIQKALATTGAASRTFSLRVWSFMNPPLWAMLAAIVVASIPDLQRFFFSDGSFVKNSVTSAIRQSGGVAVPLILVVLGANLARNTLPVNPNHTSEDDREETKLLIAALVSRMLLPIIIMAPLLAVTAKFVPVSILDDPIFVIVCFLITGAPTALQLAQICQINNVYMGAMSRLLFQSYVVWILPSTLVLVMCALEVVEWAQR